MSVCTCASAAVRVPRGRVPRWAGFRGGGDRQQAGPRLWGGRGGHGEGHAGSRGPGGAVWGLSDSLASRWPWDPPMAGAVGGAQPPSCSASGVRDGVSVRRTQLCAVPLTTPSPGLLRLNPDPLCALRLGVLGVGPWRKGLLPRLGDGGAAPWCPQSPRWWAAALQGQGGSRARSSPPPPDVMAAAGAGPCTPLRVSGDVSLRVLR